MLKQAQIEAELKVLIIQRTDLLERDKPHSRDRVEQRIWGLAYVLEKLNHAKNPIKTLLLSPDEVITLDGKEKPQQVASKKADDAKVKKTKGKK